MAAFRLTCLRQGVLVERSPACKDDLNRIRDLGRGGTVCLNADKAKAKAAALQKAIGPTVESAIAARVGR